MQQSCYDGLGLRRQRWCRGVSFTKVHDGPLAGAKKLFAYESCRDER